MYYLFTKEKIGLSFALPSGGKENYMAADTTSFQASGGWYISLGIYIFIALSVIIGALVGLRRGAPKMTVRLVTVIASAVGAFFISTLIVKGVNSAFEGKTLEEVIRSIYSSYDGIDARIRDVIASFDAETAEYILMIPIGAVIAPLAFAFVFVILELLMLIIYKIITAIAGMSSYKTGKLSKGMGALIGAVQGVFVAAVILIPISGYSSLASEYRDDLTCEEIPEDISDATQTAYTEWIDGVTDNVALKAVNTLGGRMTFDALSGVRVGEDKYTMTSELDIFVDVYVEAIGLSGTDWKSPTEDQKEKISNIADLLCRDEFTATIASGLLRGASNAVHRGAIVIPLEEPFKSLCEAATDTFLDSNRENLGEVVSTVKNCYFIIADSDAISALTSGDKDQISNLLTVTDENGHTVITNLTNELNSNPRTAPITTAITKVSLAIMSQELALDDSVIEVYDNVKNELNDILAINKEDYATEEEYTEAVGHELDTALTKNGIELDDEIIDEMAGYIAENFSDITEITDNDINMAILSYYDAYAELIASGALDGQE